jgi:hypothetical protein
MKKLISIFVMLSFLNISTVGSATTTTRARILTKFNIEKVASCATADLQYICMQDENNNLTMMNMDVKNMYAKTLKVVFKPGTIKGPANAPGMIKNVSEPQMPKHGNYVSFIGSSNGRRYLTSIDADGKTMKLAPIPDTTFEGVKTIWDLLWFRLNYNGLKYFGVARGTVVEKGKKGTCFALIVMNTDGTEPTFIYRPRWTGTKFEFSKDSPGALISPIGMSRDSMRIFYKAEIGLTKKHGIYSCNYDGTDVKLVMTASGTFQQTVKSAIAWAPDLVTDNGKYLVLNDNGLSHKGAVSVNATTGAVLARLPHKVFATSCNSQFAFFANSVGFGIGFIIGGEPQILVKPSDPGYPALGKLNNRRTPGEPAISPTTCQPFGILGRSETDVRGKGQLYFTEILSPPIPPSPRLVLEPPVIDMGIISDAAQTSIGIRNPGQTAISGVAAFENGQECSVFSFDGKSEAKFSEICDIPINVDPTCLEAGQTKEAYIRVTSTGGKSATPIVATRDNPEVVLCKAGIGRLEGWIGTKPVTLKAEPFIESGSSMVPLALLLDALPCDYSWDADNNMAIVEYQNMKVELTAESNSYMVDDQEKTLSKPPVIRNNSLMVPVSLLKEDFGCKAAYFSKTQTLILEFPQPVWGRETIEIDGLPEGGQVYLNNQGVGIAPLQLRHLQPGRYWVKVKLEGYEDYEKIIEIPPSPNKVFYFLQRVVPTTALLKVTSKPVGAYVYIDDRLLGASPQTIELEPGLHKLKVVMSGYPEYITDVVALKGEEINVEADLETLRTRFVNFVTPKELTGAIILPKQDRVTFDVTIKNESTMPQAFIVKCPNNPSKGFSGMFIQTFVGLVQEIKTPAIMPGEQVECRFVAVTDSFVAPDDEYADKIQINSASMQTWKTELPFRVKIEGKIPEPPLIVLEVPENVVAGQTFDVKIRILDAYDLMGCKFRFTFQPNRTSIYDVTEGDFMNADCKTLFSWKEFTSGEIVVTGPARICKNGLDGTGILMTLTFRALKEGELIIDPSNVELYDSKGERIKARQANSVVINVGKP